ncbi:MAG: hypothetical protein ACK4RN_08975 [Pseudorhodobacter sp.]
MSKQHFLTAEREASPAFVEISAMLDSMNKQIDQLREMLELMGAASEVIKTKADSKAAPREGARPVERGALAAMFPEEEIH